MTIAAEAKVKVANEVPMALQSKGREEVENYMSQTPDNAKRSGTPQVETIESRFGAVSVDRSKAIFFPVGILGMPEMHHFVLTEFPNKKLGQFKLLQSLDDLALSFITLPLQLDNSIVAREDVETAARDMEIPVEQLGMVMIVSVHRGMTGVQLSVNARAPIFFDTTRLAAAQYVFTSNKYQVQHFITAGKDTGQKADGE